MSNASSSASFSHQFYQHWTVVPDSIRAAIVQELTDINTLLQPHTDFESFTFSEHDFAAHLNNLYLSLEDEQVAINSVTNHQIVENQPSESESIKTKTEENDNDSNPSYNTSSINHLSDKAKQGSTIEVPQPAPELSTENEDLIHELGMHIDDYLSDQMTQMSEDLKSWLRAEMSRQLSEQLNAPDHNNDKI